MAGEESGDVSDHRPTVLVMLPLMSPYDEVIGARFRLLEAWKSSLPAADFLTAHAGEARVLLCSGPRPHVTAEIVSLLPKLEVVVGSSAGVDHIDVEECRRRGIAVTNAGDVFSDDVADYAVGMLMDVLRKVSAADRYVRQGLWQVTGKYPLGSKLGGKRVGIIGLGSIGLRVAKRLEAFGCDVSYNSRTHKSSAPYHFFSDVYELASASDVLVVTCALTGETFHLVNKDIMLALGKGGIVINVARGALIDEKQLVSCLLEGDIGGAGLDVFEDEPNVPEELFEMDNVVLSNHDAFRTPEGFHGLLQVVIGNLDAFFSEQSSQGDAGGM